MLILYHKDTFVIEGRYESFHLVAEAHEKMRTYYDTDTNSDLYDQYLVDWVDGMTDDEWRMWMLLNKKV